MKFCKIALFLLCCAAVGSFSAAAQEEFEPDIRDILPGFTGFGEKKGTVVPLLDKDDRVIGKLLTAPAKYKRIEGHTDFINVAVVTNKRGRICGVAIGKNKESENILQKCREKGLLKRWNGKYVKDAVKIKVDAITGATSSSAAIKAEVQSILQANKEINQ